jgi:hypothetical protein
MSSCPVIALRLNQSRSSDFFKTLFTCLHIKNTFISFIFTIFVLSFRCIYSSEQFRYLGTTLTNRNSIQEEIKSSSKSGNACYHSVQDLLSSSLPSKNTKTKIYRTIILPVVLYGCET